MNIEAFIRLRLTGASFDEHAIPFGFLKRISSLEEMAVALARAKYIEDHHGRTPPRGLTSGAGLSLTTLEVGSAVADIEVVFTRQASFDARRYFNFGCAALTDILGMEEELPDETPRQVLAGLRRIGSGLHEGDVIEITGRSLSSPVRLSKRSRILQGDQLVGSNAPSIAEPTRRLSVSGQVSTADQLTMTFRMQLEDGKIAAAPMSSDHRHLVLEALIGYASGTRLQVDGFAQTGRREPHFTFNLIDNVEILHPAHWNEVIDVATLAEMGDYERTEVIRPSETQPIIGDSTRNDIEEALDITRQLDELRSLEDGWLEGGGAAPFKEGLDWLNRSFERHYPTDLPRPYLFPTEDGGVQAEWIFEEINIEVRIDLSSRLGTYFWLDESIEEERELDLSDGANWSWLASVVREHAKR